MKAWVLLLLLWIAPAVALLLLLLRTAVRKGGSHKQMKGSDAAERQPK